MNLTRCINPDSGFVLGNGKILVTTGSAQDLKLRGKAHFNGQRCCAAKIQGLIGPFLTSGNFLSGLAPMDSEPWQREKTKLPAAGNSGFQIELENANVLVEIEDQTAVSEPVFLRRLAITARKTTVITLEAEADPRNFEFQNYDGSLVDPMSDLAQPSILPAESGFRSGHWLIFRAAPRRIFQDLSNAYPISVQTRSLAVGLTLDLARCIPKGWQLSVKKGQTLTVTLICACGHDDHQATAFAEQWLAMTPEQRDAGCCSSLKELPIRVKGDRDGRLMNILYGADMLCRAAASECGGTLAQCIMYPMNYIRDQMGAARWYQRRSQAQSLRKLLDFYLAEGQQLGLQNAYDPVAALPDWDPDQSWPMTDWEKTELPSYLVLFAALEQSISGDLDYLRRIYPCLRDEFQRQQFSEIDQLCSSGDETYFHLTSIAERCASSSGPFDQAENFTDSCLLWLRAAQFLIESAEQLGLKQDAAELTAQAARVKQSLRRHNLDRQSCLTAQADHPDIITDVLCMPVWLDLDWDRKMLIRHADRIAAELMNPVRVQPDRQVSAGMTPAMILSLFSELDHPQREAALMQVLDWSGVNGLFYEYYRLTPEGIEGYSGAQRVWETACSASAILDYLIGIRQDTRFHQLTLHPHCPPFWDSFEYILELNPEDRLTLKVCGASLSLSYQLKNPWSLRLIVRGEEILCTLKGTGTIVR